MHKLRTQAREIYAHNLHFIANADDDSFIVGRFLGDVIVGTIECEKIWESGHPPSWETANGPVSFVDGLARTIPEGAIADDPQGDMGRETIHRLDDPHGESETYWIEAHSVVRAFTRTDDAIAWRNAAALFGVDRADLDAYRTMEDRGF